MLIIGKAVDRVDIGNCSASESEATMSDILDEQEFYELMQAYRHAPTTNQIAVTESYEDIKTYIRNRVVSELRTELTTAKEFIAEHVGVEPEIERDPVETGHEPIYESISGERKVRRVD